MQKEKLPEVYYRGNEFVMVRKGQEGLEGFKPGSVVCVDTNENGDYAYQAVVGKDGIWSLAFRFTPEKINKAGLPFGKISMFTRTADGSKNSEPYTFQAVQKSTDNPGKNTGTSILIHSRLFSR